MSGTPFTILVLGNDRSLLQNRRWMLESWGYNLVNLTHLRELDRLPRGLQVRLAILWHSLRPGQAQRAMARIRKRWSSSAIVYMEPGVHRPVQRFARRLRSVPHGDRTPYGRNAL